MEYEPYQKQKPKTINKKYSRYTKVIHNRINKKELFLYEFNTHDNKFEAKSEQHAIQIVDQLRNDGYYSRIILKPKLMFKFHKILTFYVIYRPKT